MKILVLGDIHGRLLWADIIEKEQPDLTIFLGDYVSTHDGVPADQQLSNLEDILSYKEAKPDKVILLRGNHDMQHLGYHWAECSGWDPEVAKGMALMKERFLSLTQWIYRIPDTNIVCSHAGISDAFLRNVEKYLVSHGSSQYDDGSIDAEVVIDLINSIEPCELFGFTPCKMSDHSGESATQPCTWIRPWALAYHSVEGITYVVGHTPIAHINNIHNEATIKAGYPKDGPDIWVCDCLANKEYLIIEDGKFRVGKMK